MPDPETNGDNFLNDVIIPVLDKVDMRTAEAEKLLMMTATHESMGFRYRQQINGPALSFFQIEPATLNDLYENYLSFRPDRQAVLDSFLPEGMERLEALEKNDDYACCAARFIYWRVPEAIPPVADDGKMAAYAKKYWNTEEGKATAKQYLDDFERYGPENPPADWQENGSDTSNK